MPISDLSDAAALAVAKTTMPAGFYCPLTRKPLADPVLAADGYSYERAALAAWQAVHGADLSPKTLQTMPTWAPMPNETLARTIREFRAQQGLHQGGPSGEDWRDNLRCLVTHETMQRPVALSDRRDYELEAARRLVATYGRQPLTRQPFLAVELLRPNRALQQVSSELSGRRGRALHYPREASLRVPLFGAYDKALIANNIAILLREPTHQQAHRILIDVTAQHGQRAVGAALMRLMQEHQHHLRHGGRMILNQEGAVLTGRGLMDLLYPLPLLQRGIWHEQVATAEYDLGQLARLHALRPAAVSPQQSAFLGRASAFIRPRARLAASDSGHMTRGTVIGNGLSLVIMYQLFAVHTQGLHKGWMGVAAVAAGGSLFGLVARPWLITIPAGLGMVQARLATRLGQSWEGHRREDNSLCFLQAHPVICGVLCGALAMTNDALLAASLRDVAALLWPAWRPTIFQPVFELAAATAGALMGLTYRYLKAARLAAAQLPR